MTIGSRGVVSYATYGAACGGSIPASAPVLRPSSPPSRRLSGIPRTRRSTWTAGDRAASGSLARRLRHETKTIGFVVSRGIPAGEDVHAFDFDKKKETPLFTKHAFLFLGSRPDKGSVNGSQERRAQSCRGWATLPPARVGLQYRNIHTPIGGLGVAKGRTCVVNQPCAESADIAGCCSVPFMSAVLLRSFPPERNSSIFSSVRPIKAHMTRQPVV